MFGWTTTFWQKLYEISIIFLIKKRSYLILFIALIVFFTEKNLFLAHKKAKSLMSRMHFSFSWNMKILFQWECLLTISLSKILTKHEGFLHFPLFSSCKTKESLENIKKVIRKVEMQLQKHNRNTNTNMTNIGWSPISKKMSKYDFTLEKKN